MTIKVYIPRETTASSLGVEAVVEAIKTEALYRKLDIEIVRNGSRGACFLAPLVEVITAAGRLGYGPVQVEDVAELLDAGFLQGGKHKLALGNVEELPWFKNQERLTFARCGVIAATSVAEYKNLGGFVGLQNVLAWYVIGGTVVCTSSRPRNSARPSAASAASGPSTPKTFQS